MHHVEEEEHELFPQVREQLSDELPQLAERMQRRYREVAKREPSQNVPNETSAAAEL